MSTEAVLVIVAASVILITLLTYMAGRAEHRRYLASRAEEPRRPEAVAPGHAHEAAYAEVAREADRSLLSERDVVIGDEAPGGERERDVAGRFGRNGSAIDRPVDRSY